MTLPATVDETVSRLAQGDYVAERSLATAVFLTLKMRRPLFLEGEAGVGKTEVARGARRGAGAGGSSGCSATKGWTWRPPSTSGTTRGR